MKNVNTILSNKLANLAYENTGKQLSQNKLIETTFGAMVETMQECFPAKEDQVIFMNTLFDTYNNNK